MNGDQIIHSVDVSGYWRTTPTGRRVWVPKYERKGNAQEDDKIRRMSEQRAAHEVIYVNPARKRHREVQRITKETGKPGMEAYTFKKLNDALKNQEKAVKAEADYKPTVADKVKYAAIDVKEAVQEKVGNLISEISFQAESVKDVTEAIVQGTPQVKSAVQLGFSMIKNWFSGLFGRK